MEILYIYLFVSIFVSFIILYMLHPKQKIIIKYPSIDDPISDLYIDDNNVCYRYHRKELELN